MNINSQVEHSNFLFFFLFSLLLNKTEMTLNQSPSAIQVCWNRTRWSWQTVFALFWGNSFCGNQLAAIFFLFSFFSFSLLLQSEWLTNQHRDTYASYVGHHSLTSLIALAENESSARVKFNMLEVFLFLKNLSSPSSSCSNNPLLCPLQKMILPCGPPPAKND